MNQTNTVVGNRICLKLEGQKCNNHQSWHNARVIRRKGRDNAMTYIPQPPYPLYRPQTSVIVVPIVPVS